MCLALNLLCKTDCYCNVASKNKDASDLLQYVLTPAQMLGNDYPLSSYMKDGSINANSASAPDEIWDKPPNLLMEETGRVEVIAIDCKMVSQAIVITSDNS